MSLPAALYKTVEEKIPQGCLTDDVDKILSIKDDAVWVKFGKLPSIKNLLIPEEVFADFGLTVSPCSHQSTSSKGVIKQAKAICFDDRGLTFCAVDGKDGIDAIRIKVITTDKLHEYNIVGNILVKAKK